MNKWLNIVADSFCQGVGWTFGIVAGLWIVIAIGAWPSL